MRETRNDRTVSSSGLRALGSERLKLKKVPMPEICWDISWIIIRFWELPTYPSPEPTLTLTSHLGQNVGFEEG